MKTKLIVLIFSSFFVSFAVARDAFLHATFLSEPSKLLCKNTKKWASRYAINNLCPTDRMAIASGLYYLLQDSPKNEQGISDNLATFYLSTACYHDDCKHALLKACEKSLLASYKLSNNQTKDFMWKESLIQYYTTVFKTLSTKNRTVTYGKDRGKNLPNIEALKADFEKAMMQQRSLERLFIHNKITLVANNQQLVIHFSLSVAVH